MWYLLEGSKNDRGEYYCVQPGAWATLCSVATLGSGRDLLPKSRKANSNGSKKWLVFQAQQISLTPYLLWKRDRKAGCHDSPFALFTLFSFQEPVFTISECNEGVWVAQSLST